MHTSLSLDWSLQVRKLSILLKSDLSSAEIWRNRHILCIRLPFDLTLTGRQTYAALANQQPVYVRHLSLSFKCFCITTSLMAIHIYIKMKNHKWHICLTYNISKMTWLKSMLSKENDRLLESTHVVYKMCTERDEWLSASFGKCPVIHIGKFRMCKLLTPTNMSNGAESL